MNNEFLKQLGTVITYPTKAKSLAPRTKASTLKKGVLLFSLFRNKRFLTAALSQRINNLLPSSTRDENVEGGEDLVEKDKAIVLRYARHEELEEKYLDLRHGLFREEEEGEFEDPRGSVVDIVKGTKGEGEEFNLEDEINMVADLFIRRFRRQMRMQNSLKRVHDMLQRS